MSQIACQVLALACCGCNVAELCEYLDLTPMAVMQILKAHA